jgi:nitrite reductase/ring-hydroxylating ferredoxin subunit
MIRRSPTAPRHACITAADPLLIIFASCFTVTFQLFEVHEFLVKETSPMSSLILQTDEGPLTPSNLPIGTSVIASYKDPKDQSKKIVVVRATAENEFTVFSAYCTHAQCVVQPAGGELTCACHGSVFDAQTGEVTHGPAKTSLPSFKVSVEAGNLVIEG